MKKQELLKRKYGNSFLSQSSNFAVLLVYEIVLDNLDNGFNYWEEDHGANEISGIFEGYFFNSDYIELYEDLTNWSNDQLYRFTQGIIGGYHSSIMSDRTLNNYYLVNNSTPFKLRYINKLLEIESERNIRGDFSKVINDDELDFLILHFDYLLNNDPSSLKTYTQIAERLNIKDDKAQNAVELLSKIKNATISSKKT